MDAAATTAPADTVLHFEEPDCVTEEMRMMRDQVRRFVDSEVRPVAETWEEAGKIPREIFRALGALGVLGMRHEEAYGGTDLGPVASIVFAEELGRSTFGGFTSSVLVHSDMSATHITARGTHEQKQKYLPDIIAGKKVCAVAVTEPGAGSDVAGLRTRAVRDGSDWLISGSKMFITNGVYGDVYIVAARTDPDALGAAGISLFIVEKETVGFSVAAKLKKHGWLCSDTAELYFDEARVPAENLLGAEGRGFYGIMDTFQNERLCIGGICAGESAKALEVTLDYVRTRKAFGKSLWDLQATRQRLASLATRAAASRALTYQTAVAAASGKDITRDASMIKALAPEVLHDVVHGCLHLHGGTGFMHGTVIERMARDARVLTIGGGATEVMLEEVAKRM